MTLSPVASEEHVDEAIRLFNHSTMSAIQSGSGKFSNNTQPQWMDWTEDSFRVKFPRLKIKSADAFLWDLVFLNVIYEKNCPNRYKS